MPDLAERTRILLDELKRLGQELERLRAEGCSARQWAQAVRKGEPHVAPFTFSEERLLKAKELMLERMTKRLRTEGRSFTDEQMAEWYDRYVELFRSVRGLSARAQAKNEEE